MASSTHRVGPNFRDVIVKGASMRLSDATSRTTTDYAEVICGDGVPSGAYGRDSGATLVYLRKDASSVATAMYVSVNGGTAWTAMDPSAVSGADITFNDTFAAKFGTPGTDLVLTADGTDVIVTGTGDLVFNDSVDLKIGTGKDIGIAWDGTRLNVTQALANSEIRWGVDGAGIDQVFYGDTASAALTWDQSADSLILSGVAKIKAQVFADPGTGQAIPVTHSGSVPLTIGGAETNTLAIPTYEGQTLSIYAYEVTAGSRAITCAQAINQAGNTIMTFAAARDFIKLEGINTAAGLRWQVVSNDGAALS